MSAMTTVRVRHHHDFVVVANRIAQDNTLSLRARGLFLYLFSLPDGWQTSAERLAEQVPEGAQAVQVAARELERAGYLIRRRRSLGRSSWEHSWELQDTPLLPSVTGQSPVSSTRFSSDETSPDENRGHSREYEVQRTQDQNQPLPPVVPHASADERPDVQRVCDALADAIEANGSKRPVVTARWRTDARLLLDRDGRTVEQALTAVAWCQSHEFWRVPVQSMGKFRRHYDAMRLDAQRGQRGTRPSTTGLRVAEAKAVAARFRERAAQA